MLYLYAMLKRKISLLSWFLGAPERKKFAFMHEAPDYFVFENFNFSMPLEKLAALYAGCDAESRSLLANYLRFKFFQANKVYVYDSSFNKHDMEKKADAFLKEIPSLSKRYHIPEENILPECFYFHHGRRHAPEFVKEYIKEKIFVDAGAYIGDSAVILNEYQPAKIYSFEMNPEICSTFRKTMIDNNISEDQIQIIEKGLGERCERLTFEEKSYGGCHKSEKGEKAGDFTSIDEFFKEKSTIGLIKADVEGALIDLLKGAVKTIQRDRPVLSLSIYHTETEFFEAKPFIESLDLNYRYHFIHNRFTGWNSEISLFAYPAELEKNTDVRD